jgi:hypothetical protein
MMGAHVSMDEAGNAVIAWTTQGACGYTLSAAVSAAGEAWGPPSIIGDGGCDAGGGNNTGPFLWTTASGGRAVVAIARSGSGDRLTVVFHDFEGGWGPPRSVGSSGSAHIANVRTSLDHNGTATVVWTEGLFGQNQDIFARSVAQNGSLGELIVAEGTLADATVWGWGPTVTKNGTILLVWSTGEGEQAEIHAGRISPSGSISVTVFKENLTGICCQAPFYFANEDGYQVILRSIGGGPNTASWVRTAGPDGAWSDASHVDPIDAGPHQWADFAIDSDGAVLLLWREMDGALTNYSVQRKPPGEDWQPRVLLASQPGFPGTGGRLVVAKGGAAIATWSLLDGSNQTFTAVAQDSNGSWSAPWVWSPNSTTRMASGVDAAIDLNGNAVVAWFETNYTSGENRIWTLRTGVVAPAAPQLVVVHGAPIAPSDAQTYEVAGWVEPRTEVSVQGHQVQVQPNGSFVATVPLAFGNNTIIVVATNPEGVSVVQRVFVTRQAAEPPLESPEGGVKVQPMEAWALLLPAGAVIGAIGVFALLRARRSKIRRP